MNSKSEEMAKVFSRLAFSSLVLVFIALLAVYGSSAFNFFGDTFSYSYDYLFSHAWDTVKIIVVAVLAVAVIGWVIWCITSQVKTKGRSSLVGPALVLIVPFSVFVTYHNRSDIQTMLNDNNRMIGTIALLCFVILLVAFGILAIIFGIIGDHKIAKELKEEAENEEECECCNSRACEELEEEVVILRRDVDELQEQVRALSESRGKRTLESAVVPPEKNKPVVDDIPPVVVVGEEIEVEVPVAVAKKKVIRRPFAEKMAKASPEIKENYDIIKNELISYGVKSRLSNGGDTFRLRRETYALITLVGKNLKVYLAVDPRNYENTTIPAKDESGKKRYEETPTMLRIKSKLSVKRAKMLIADLMKAHELEQKEVKDVKYSEQVKARKARKAISK